MFETHNVSLTSKKECDNNMLTEEFLGRASKARGNELLTYARVKVARGVQDNYLEDTLDVKRYNEVVKRVMELIDKVTENAVMVELLR